MLKRWCVLLAALLVGAGAAWSADEGTPTEPAARPAQNPTITSDELTFEGGVAVYTGVTKPVHFAHGETSITADRLHWDAKERVAEAEGNVVLRSGELFITCVRLRYHVDTGHGVAAFTVSGADPWYAWGEKIYRISDTEYRVHNGYVTTDDYPEPNWRIRAKTIVIHPNEKVVAHGAVVYAGRVPVLYWPKYVQRLDDKRSPISIRAGRTGPWGTYLLTAYNFMVRRAQASVHVDYRENQHWATGFDLRFPTLNDGEGDLLTYYADDQSGRRDDESGLRDETDRWRVSYRHRQPLDERWDAWFELHKLSDIDMLEDFFRRDFENEIQPRNLLHVQRYDRYYMINFDARVQLNDFYEVVERLPDFSIEFPLQRLGRSPFYYEGTSSAAYLRRLFAEGAVDENGLPIEDYESARVDTFHEFSYPRKYFGWLNVVPRLGLRGTYYSEGVAGDDVFRGLVSSELEFFTKIFKVWDTERPEHNIRGLRHVIEPRLVYFYTPEPDKGPEDLLQFDQIDQFGEENRLRLGTRNKLQTKRYGGVWDLVDFDTYIDYFPEDNAAGDQWGDVHHEIEIRPNRTFWVDVDIAWDVDDADLTEFNTQCTVFDEDLWLQSLEYRYRKSDDAHLVAHQSYTKLTELWWIETYARQNFDTGQFEEGELAVTHDLRTWLMTLAYRTLDDDDQVWVMFNLKAYPETGIRVSE
ncbi:MAG: LPS-assembly protein LptD [Verrucomicrobia bacterium]|nr:LPS-assembly protein LptD [Verrucomicrobiota bacterium]